MMEDNTLVLLVAAIDLGTTYSGYAFSFRGDYVREPLKIVSNQAWTSGGKNLTSLKTPTSLLLDKAANFVSFGYDAENKYVDSVMDGCQADYYYFERFKMSLYDNETLSENMMLEDVTGRKLSAITVFSLSIKALRDHLLDLLSTQGTAIQEEEIMWVITVPAIWGDAAKQFMRICAEKTGIKKHHRKIALEPEAASIYCQHLPVTRLEGATTKFTVSKTGTKYMVIDLGGGTADITVHEKLEDGILKELHKASGGACGGTFVDKQFLNIIKEIFGEKFMARLQGEKGNFASFLDFMREFEAVKRTLTQESNRKVNMSIPYVALNNLCLEIHGNDLETMIKSSIYADKLTLLGDKLRIDAYLAKSFFEPVAKAIVSHVNTILSISNVEDLEMLLMVGGFSECKIIQDAIRKAFPTKKLIVPHEPGLAVLKGAVLFGHDPTSIISRILKFTYGTDICKDFDPALHKDEKMETVDGKIMCKDIFSPIVKAGTSISLHHSEIGFYNSLQKFQECFALKIYTSPEESPKYVTDDGCKELGCMYIEIPDPTEKPRHLLVQYVFGDTEIRVIAMESETLVPYISYFKMI